MSPVLPPFLQDLFDRGQDPLDDPDALAWLERHAEHLRAFAALRATLREVSAVPPRTAWPRQRWPFLLVAGAAALLLSALWVFAAWWPADTADPAPALAPPSTVLPRPLFAPRSCVLSISTTERIGDETRTFASATVHGTLSRQTSTTFSTTPTDRRPPTVFLRTTVLEETIRP